MLLHETHKIIGLNEFEFETLFRERWLPTMAEKADTRLLWYFHLAHGSNISYRFVTITALRDFASWEHLALRSQSGDLRPIMAELDGCRYQLDAKLLFPLPWSPMQDINLGDVPVSTDLSHDLALYVQDTVRPEEGRIEETIKAAGERYARQMGDGDRAVHLVGAFQPFPGAGRRRELVLLHQVDSKDRLAEYYMDGTGKPGTLWSALDEDSGLGDTWESWVLRTSSWSPWP